MPRYRIGVIGYGIAGAVSAYLLAKAGHAVMLFERAPAVKPIGAGVLLQLSGQAILNHLGVLDHVLKHSAELEELHAVHTDGRTLIRNRYPDYEPTARSYGVHRGVLFDAVRGLVETQAVEVKLGIEIVGRTRSADGKVILSDSRGKNHGPFDFVLCGDGSRSNLRNWLGRRHFRWDYNHGAIWITAPLTSIRNRLLQVVKGSKQLCGILPLGDGLGTLYWGAPVKEFEAIRQRGLDSLKSEIRVFAPQATELLEHLVDPEQLIFTTYRAIWMSRRFDRHALFFGDSAHAMSPHLGQGINLAMVDAWALAESIEVTDTPLEAFRLWHRRQAGYQRYYAATTFALSPFFQSDWTILGWGRDLALPLLPKLPFIKREMLRTMCGVKGGFLKGEHPLPGRRTDS